MSTLQIVVIVGLTAAGSIVHGSVGIGLGLVAAPALVAIDPAFTPGPLLFVAQIVGVRHILAERDYADIAALKNSLWGVPPGIALALVINEMMTDRSLAIVVGSLTAAAAAMLLMGMQMERTPRAEKVAGFACAFASMTASLPGPPLVCVYSDMKPQTMRPTSSMLILTVAVSGFITLLLTGNFGSREVELIGWLLPGAIIGLIASRFVRPYLDKPWFRPMVLVIALIGGVALVLRQLL